MEETNILVVDDEKEIADLLEIYLISDGFQVLKAYSAKAVSYTHLTLPTTSRV